MFECLNRFSTPQLKLIHSGKVRDSYRINDTQRLIVTTDRISCFDQVLNTPIPLKGAVLNGISNYWFDLSSDIIDNHIIQSIDPNIMLVKEAKPIRVEMIVRGYLTGSMWRNYSKGQREFSGIKVTDGLKQNQKFPEPLVTPTTKEESDQEISPAEIISSGLATKELYESMEQISKKLYNMGSHKLLEKGFLLVDTKYEFGLLDGRLILIDELHTPDSSRFWQADMYNKDPLNVDSVDKEYVRQWLLKNKVGDKYPKSLPNEVIFETTNRYRQIYETIVDKPLETALFHDPEHRTYHNLVHNNIIKDGYVVIVMGSTSDIEHCKKIKTTIEKYDIKVEMRVVSAHRNGEEIIKLAKEYNNSIEPGVAIAVAGRSNGLGGALAANLTIPVLNCPPFKDQLDMLVNISSSLIMPSRVPAATVIEPECAALMAIKALNLSRLRKIFEKEISDIKTKMLEDDLKIREL